MNKKESFNPLVSIVIPVYNGSNYVKEAINSAIAQTYKNIEIIVVNDGSTDDTEKIVKSYGKKLRYFKKENGGVATALNLGIKEAKGEYISWLSHDDMYYPNKIERQLEDVERVSKQKTDKTIVYSNYSLINESSEIISELRFEKNHFIEKLNQSLYPLLNGLINGCTLLIPKQCFEVVGYFDSDLKSTQDYDLWFKMLLKFELIFNSDVLVKTRIHSNQSTKLNLGVIKECDSLWIKMVNTLSNKQKINISGSVISFHKKIYEIVKSAGYVGAENYLLNILNDYKNRDISKIKVSIIIPFFNRVNWTVEAIKSVINQTHSNIEIILIDDASTENINKILDLVKTDLRISYFRNKKNSGVSISRNYGIRKAKGEYIAFLDSDDIYILTKVETQLRFMVSYGYSFTHTSYSTFPKIDLSENNVNSGSIDYMYPSIIAGCSIATPTVMVTRDVLSHTENMFPEAISIGEDVCLWIQLSKQFRLYGLNIVLTKVRKHNNNAADSVEKQIIGIKNQIDFVFDNIVDERSVPELKKLNSLLFNYLDVRFNLVTHNLCKSDTYSFEYILGNIKRKIKGNMLILFYKIDKVVPKNIRIKVKSKLIKYGFVKKYFINS